MVSFDNRTRDTQNESTLCKLWSMLPSKPHIFSFLKFSTTSLKHSFSWKLPNWTSKDSLMKATKLILTIWCGCLRMSTSIIWPAWSAPLRILAQPVVSSTGKSSKVQIQTWPCWALPRTSCPVLCSSMHSWKPLSKTLFPSPHYLQFKGLIITNF